MPDVDAPRDTLRDEIIECFRAALMREHHDDWDMETVSEAAHICAAAWADRFFGAGQRS